MTTLATQTSATSSRGAQVSAWVSVLALIVALVTSPFDTGGDLLPAGAATVVDGTIQRSADGEWETVAEGTTLPVGSVVRAGQDDRGRLETATGVLELAPGAELVLGEETIDLRAGSLLLEADELTTVTLGVVRASGEGIWRVDAGSFPRVAVYDGGVAVRDAPDREQAVGRLEQIGLPEGRLASGTVPLRYIASDPWDARFLSDAIAVDRLADQLQQALEQEYGDRPQVPDFYRDFAAAPEIVSAVLGQADGVGTFGPVSNLLLRIVTVEALAGAGLDPSRVAAEVTGLRRDGASWGLIFAAQDLGVEALRDAADRALRRREQAVDEGTAAAVQVEPELPAPPVAAPEPEVQPPTPDTSPEPSPPSDENPPPDDEPEPTPTPTPVPEVVEDPVGTVEELLPSTSEEDEGAVDTTGEVVEDTVNGTGDALEGTVGGVLDLLAPGS